MDVKIITDALELDIYGFAGVASNRDYAGTAFKLMDRMWQVVKSNQLPNKGKNIWVYEDAHAVFAGVELDNIPPAAITIEHKKLSMAKYAWYKHIGPYQFIGQSGRQMRDELKRKGFETVLPYVEIYGHWTNDETQLETELLMCLK